MNGTAFGLQTTIQTVTANLPKLSDAELDAYEAKVRASSSSDKESMLMAILMERARRKQTPSGGINIRSVVLWGVVGLVLWHFVVQKKK